MTILILQPIRPSNPPALRAIADALLAGLEGANPGMSFDICQDDSALDIPPHQSIYFRHAMVRNYMLDRYLKPHHTHVLWIDSDLISYPAELPSVLMDASGVNWTRGAEWDCSIVAPFVMLDKLANRFYDIGGFIENGNRARLWPPYFEQTGDMIELDSVGCCYLAPASLYHAGVRYAPPPSDYYVEHWSVMQQAKARGMRIVALSNVRAIHAWLPDYGLEAH